MIKAIVRMLLAIVVYHVTFPYIIGFFIFS